LGSFEKTGTSVKEGGGEYLKVGKLVLQYNQMGNFIYFFKVIDAQ
jgi:hypothetical protein